jgi:class 3 adenylate cyclase
MPHAVAPRLARVAAIPPAMQAYLACCDAPEILVNIGINTGQVLLGATMIKGTVGEHFTYTASGMITNIASRLCDLGNQGEIHLSSATAQLVMNHFTLDGPLETHLKNIRGMLPVYKLA